MPGTDTLIRHPANCLPIHHCRESVGTVRPCVESETHRVYGVLINPAFGQPNPRKPNKLGLEPDGVKGRLLDRPGTPDGRLRFRFDEPGGQQILSELPPCEGVAVMLAYPQ